jgi:hypothetical protein
MCTCVCVFVCVYRRFNLGLQPSGQPVKEERKCYQSQPVRGVRASAFAGLDRRPEVEHHYAGGYNSDLKVHGPLILFAPNQHVHQKDWDHLAALAQYLWGLDRFRLDQKDWDHIEALAQYLWVLDIYIWGINVYICVCVCVCVHTRTRTRTRVCTHTRTRVCTHTRTRIGPGWDS